MRAERLSRRCSQQRGVRPACLPSLAQQLEPPSCSALLNVRPSVGCRRTLPIPQQGAAPALAGACHLPAPTRTHPSAAPIPGGHPRHCAACPNRHAAWRPVQVRGVVAWLGKHPQMCRATATAIPTLPPDPILPRPVSSSSPTATHAREAMQSAAPAVRQVRQAADGRRTLRSAPAGSGAETCTCSLCSSWRPPPGTPHQHQGPPA